MNMDMILGLMRHVFTFVGGWLVAKGILDEGTATELSGAVVTIVGVILSFVSKKTAAKKLDAAVAAPAGQAE